MNPLVRSIRQDAWMMEASTLASYAPLAMLWAMGSEIKFPEPPENKDSFYFTDNKGNLFEQPQLDNVQDAVATYDVKGIILKEDQWCGPRGMVSLLNKMRQLDADGRVIAHVFNVDSGGGQATFMNRMAHTIRENIEKPILTSFNGMAASAAYYLSSATDGIYSQEKTDLLGSIGTLASWMDIKGYYEALGVKFHEVYADKSKLKGEIMKKAEEDEDYSLLKEKILNPHNDEFIAAIKAFRPELTDEGAYEGELFPVVVAPEGMVDGTMSFEDCIAQAHDMGMTRKTSKNTYAMPNAEAKSSYPKLLAHLGIQEIEQQEDGFISLSPDQLDVIEQALPSEEESVVKTSEITGIKNTMEALNGALNSLNGEIKSIKDDVKAISGETGAKPAETAKGEDPESGHESDKVASGDDALDAFNKKTLERANNHQRAGFN